MQQVSDEILRKLAILYFRQKKAEPPTGGEIPPWVRNINSMEMIDVEYETRDAIRNCRELKKSVGVLEYEGEKVVPLKSKREKMQEELLDRWTYMSFYLYTLFLRSGVDVSEDEFDVFIKGETDSRNFFTNLSKR
jgi:hypothetical protein